VTARLHGRALVTGGTSGIGLAFARALAVKGCDLVLVARDPERLKQVAGDLEAAHGISVETLAADLRDRADVARVADRLTDDGSPVEIFVNNAGTGVHSALTDADTSLHEAGIDLMVRAVLVLGGAAGRAMRARGSGVIINVSSVAGQIAMGSYSAIKAWADTWSEGLALELAGTGVTVTTLLPGWVRTEFHERAGIRTSSIPDALWLDADRVVAECLADAERGRVRSVPSKRFRALSWAARHAPRPAVRRVASLIKSGRR
jgi:uncharacterized protein